MNFSGWPGDKRFLMQKTAYGVWYVTVDVPRSCRGVLNKKRIVQSLKTRDLATAQRLRWDVVASIRKTIEREFETATGKPNADLTKWALEVQEELRSLPREAWTDREMLEAGIIARAEELEARHGEEVAVQFYKVATGQRDPIAAHLDRYLSNAGMTARTNADVRTAVSELVDWLRTNGRPETVQAFDSRAAGEFRDLFLVPVKKHVRTVNKKISLLSGYWRWMAKAGIANPDTPSPWSGKSLPKPKSWQQAPEDQTTQRPFTDEEVNTLLSGHADTDLADLMRIAALSGMRLEEIGQLRVKDCADDLFDIQKSKTKAGRRKVPIHSGLAEIIKRRTQGQPQDAYIFPNFEASGWDGARTMAISKRFRTYRLSLKVDDKPEGQRRSRIDFHSFRRWFAKKCEEAGQLQTIVARVMGHETGLTITFTTYSQAQPLDLMRECVESVRLPTGSVSSD